MSNNNGHHLIIGEEEISSGAEKAANKLQCGPPNAPWGPQGSTQHHKQIIIYLTVSMFQNFKCSAFNFLTTF